MSWKVTTPKLGYPNIQATDSEQKWPIGTIVTAVDPEFGEGEFIYLPGVANTVVGDVVLYNLLTKTTTRCPATGGVGQIAIAMSPNVAGQWGWYQISGAAVMRANDAIAAGAQLYMAAIGAVDDASAAGEDIKSAISLAAAGANLSARGAHTVSGSKIITVDSLDGLFVGCTVAGTGIDSGSVITGIGPAAGLYTNQIEVDKAATATGSTTMTPATTGYVVAAVNRPFIV